MENHFDSVAQTWDNNPIHLKRTEAISEEIKKLLPGNNKLTALEFGSGTGLLSVSLKDKFSEITLMDSSLEMISVTIEKLANADIHHLKPLYFDLVKNDFTAKKIDVIFTQMVLHHIVDTNMIFSKFNNMLNSDGMLFIADLFEEDGSFHDFKFEGHFGFNPEKLSELLQNNGFGNIKYNECFVIQKETTEKIMKNYSVFVLSATKNS